jgi:alginate O-acetyltransferase complex protein AlgI
MLFSSPAFLFFFLPLFFGCYYSVPDGMRNLFIFASSIIFYYIDGGVLTLILLGSIVGNYVFGLIISYLSGWKRHSVFVVGVVLNLAPLLWFKYASLLLGTFSQYLTISWDLSKIALPAGISFFTFHALSYLADVYLRKIAPSSSLINFGMYMSNFPQLIAGPIVRYSEIADRVVVRSITPVMVSSGIQQFVFGLAKKCILADSAGTVADGAFSLLGNGLSFGDAWIGIFAYTMQIFFDFSGYSDMAIGLARMMGFNFPPNFTQPYRARNITEFWRCWHMTLSRWFRDYLYIPLGGNRKGALRTLLNLLIVFVLCGLWHGAAWGFAVWGLYHGGLLIIERILRLQFNYETSGWSGQFFTLILVMIGWVFFRSPSLEAASEYLLTLIGMVPVNLSSVHRLTITNDKIFFLVVGYLCSIFPLESLSFESFIRSCPGWMRWTAVSILGFYSCAMIAANGFNPFIYFRF